MKLSEFLNHASVETLRAIAVHQRLDCSLHSKHDLMQTILLNMRIKFQLNDLVTAWVKEWGEVIVRIAMSPRNRFSAEEVDALFNANGLTAESLGNALKQGWIFCHRQGSLRPTYIVPQEVHDALAHQIIRQYRSQVVVRAVPPLIQTEEGAAMINDLQTMLDYIRHHEVQLTTAGAIYKRHTQQLMELFEVREELSVPEWRFGYGRRTHDYPDRLALLYDFAHAQGFLVELPTGVLHVSEEEANWRHTSRANQHQQLLRFYLRLYRRPIPRLREIVQLIRQVAQDWVSVPSVLASTGNMVTDFFYDSRNDVWQKRIIKMLTHLGVIRTGYDEESDELWFQMTNLGQELLTQDKTNLVEESTPSQASLVVQPNFEVMVTVHDGQVESILAQFADLKSAGAIRIYRILERTVERGLNAGYDFAAWRSTLAQRSLGPIPGNVERTLLEWQAAYSSSKHPLSS